MRTNVLALVCFIAGIAPNVSNCIELAQIVDKTPFFPLFLRSYVPCLPDVPSNKYYIYMYKAFLAE